MPSNTEAAKHWRARHKHAAAEVAMEWKEQRKVSGIEESGREAEEAGERGKEIKLAERERMGVEVGKG